jgi:hypothetical protein
MVWNALSAVAGAVGALAALAGLWLTGAMMRAAGGQRTDDAASAKLARQPYVHADIHVIAGRAPTIAVVARNDGPTVATKVAFYFEPPVVRKGPYGAEIVHRLPVGTMPPGGPERFHVLGDMRWMAVQPGAPRRTTVTVAGAGPEGSFTYGPWRFDLSNAVRVPGGSRVTLE